MINIKDALTIFCKQCSFLGVELTPDIFRALKFKQAKPEEVTTFLKLLAQLVRLLEIDFLVPLDASTDDSLIVFATLVVKFDLLEIVEHTALHPPAPPQKEESTPSKELLFSGEEDCFNALLKRVSDMQKKMVALEAKEEILLDKIQQQLEAQKGKRLDRSLIEKSLRLPLDRQALFFSALRNPEYKGQLYQWLFDVIEKSNKTVNVKFNLRSLNKESDFEHLLSEFGGLDKNIPKKLKELGFAPKPTDKKDERTIQEELVVPESFEDAVEKLVTKQSVLQLHDELPYEFKLSFI